MFTQPQIDALNNLRNACKEAEKVAGKLAAFEALMSLILEQHDDAKVHRAEYSGARFKLVLKLR